MSIYIRSLMDFHKSHLNLNKKAGVLLPALPKFFQLLTCVGHITFGRTHKQLTWTTNFVLWVGNHLCPLCNPTRHTRQGKDASEQLGWDAQSTLNNT